VLDVLKRATNPRRKTKPNVQKLLGIRGGKVYNSCKFFTLKTIKALKIGKSWLLQCNQCVSQCGILENEKGPGTQRVFVHYTTRIPRVTSRFIQWMSWWVRDEYVVLSRYDTTAKISYKSSLLWTCHITVLQNGLPLSDYVWQPLGRQAMPSETWAPVGRFLCRICPPCRFCKVCVQIQHQNEALTKIGKIHPWCYLCTDKFYFIFLFLLDLPTLELFTEHRSQVW
jgi:hypothetical protein